MFRGLQNFVSDLEASARSQTPPWPQQGSQPGSPSQQRPPLAAQPAAPGSNAQLAENALSGLRKSFRTGAQSVKGSLDGIRTSGDWVRPTASSSQSPASPLQTPTKQKPQPPAQPIAEAATPAEEPPPVLEPAPWPPEPSLLGEEAAADLRARLEQAAAVALPEDLPPAPPKDALPTALETAALLAEYKMVLSQFATFKDGLPSPQDLSNFLAGQAAQLSSLPLLETQTSQHASRIQELRDTHRLEVQSLAAEVSSLKALQSKHAQQLQAAQAAAREEEEKRQKSINLLKAIRQKLTKAEQLREEAEQARVKAQNEAANSRAESEAIVNKLRAGFEREVVSLKGLHEKETAGKKSQAELELLTLKSSHNQELSARERRIRELEMRMSSLQSDKDAIFHSGQTMEAELESSQAWASDLEGQLSERQVQLQDALSQVEALQAEQVRLSSTQAESSTSAAQSQQHQEALSQLEQAYKTRISQLEAKTSNLEASRSRAEADMAATMESRLNEVERMRLDMRSSQSALEEANGVLQSWKDRAAENEVQLADAREKAKGIEALLETSKHESTRFTDRIDAVREELADSNQRISELEQRLEESHGKESQLRSANRTLRDELRKVQSGVLVSEKTRNPGVGYFANFKNNSTPAVTTSPNLSAAGSPPLSASADSLSLNEISTATGSMSNGSNQAADEAINFEYIRNVILQFLEHKEMRPHLVSVLGVILHFTPQELRRVSAKANA